MLLSYSFLSLRTVASFARSMAPVSDGLLLQPNNVTELLFESAVCGGKPRKRFLPLLEPSLRPIMSMLSTATICRSGERCLGESPRLTSHALQR